MSSVSTICCRFELVLKVRVSVTNVENAGREEKFFLEWEGVFLLLLRILSLSILWNVYFTKYM